MKDVFLIIAIFIGYALSPLQAGYVVTISDGREQVGKVSLTSTAVEVASSASSPTDIKFSEILEADFGDAPFQMNFFSSDDLKGTQFPSNWKVGDIGEVDVPGAGAVADGVFTLTGSGNFSKPKKGSAWSRLADRLYFAGQPWTGDGQFTVRIKDIDAQTLNTATGVMIRDSLDPSAAEASLETTALGGGTFDVRAAPETATRPTTISLSPPAWVRLTRFANSVFASVSTDQQNWDWVGQADFKSLENPWVGIYCHTKREQETGKATLDEVTFTPAPSSAQMFPPGVILKGGSFVAASCDRMAFEANNPDSQGSFTRSGTPLTIAASQISAVTFLPLTRSQIADLGSHLGLLMKNGDLMDGEFDSISKAGVNVNSVLLGITSYDRTDVRACVLHHLDTQPAQYEICLRDGSVIHASEVKVAGSAVTITDLSGVKIVAQMAEISQLRAGSAQVQSLAELNWKVTAPPATKPAPAPQPAANAPAAGVAPPPANAAADQGPIVGSWAGPDQQQVLQVGIGTKIDFPLTTNFRGMSMRVALASDSPPNAQAVIHVMADGRDVATTPPFKAGEEPRLVQVTVQNPKSLSLVADSAFGTIKVLYINPVALRN